MLGLINVTRFEVIAIWGVLFIAILGLGYAFLLKIQIMRKDKGTKDMQEVWGAIRQGADAYLSRQLKSILPLIFVLTVVLFLSVYVIPPSEEALQRFKAMSPDMVRSLLY